mmetsp:Transcript_24260/g.23866  ORF Transcript_24260/g.23866 Transcript_24260/m.23866 type:complete len:86 (+) Transcript_24260:633-890(+)
MEGMNEMNVDNTDFLNKIFDSVDKDKKGFLAWEEFFETIKLISSGDVRDKIELFFSIVDADGNGNFSYDEIKDICKLSLSKVKEN